MIAFTVLKRAHVSEFAKLLVSKKVPEAVGHSSPMAIAPSPVLEFKPSMSNQRPAGRMRPSLGFSGSECILHPDNLFLF